VIGSSVLSSAISFHVMFGQSDQGSNDLDHERDITLAIHAAMVADLINECVLNKDGEWRFK
jgi:hypothetical protein